MKNQFDHHLDKAKEYGKQYWKPLLIGVLIGRFLELIILLVLVALFVWGIIRLRRSKRLNKRG